MSADRDTSLTDRLSQQGEEALGRIAEELAGNPIVTGVISRALEAREKAVQVQEATLGALNIPSAADIERVTRRLRSVSQRLESIEDTLDRLDDRIAARQAAAPAAKRPAAKRKPAAAKAAKAAKPKAS